MEKTEKRGGIDSLLKPKEQIEEINEANWVRVNVSMYPKDLEIYRNFFWFMKKKYTTWGHKEIQKHIMELITEKYGNIPERSDLEKEAEKKYKR